MDKKYVYLYKFVIYTGNANDKKYKIQGREEKVWNKRKENFKMRQVLL